MLLKNLSPSTAPRTCRAQSRTRATWATYSSRKWQANLKTSFKSRQLLLRHQASETTTQALASLVLRVRAEPRVASRYNSLNKCRTAAISSEIMASRLSSNRAIWVAITYQHNKISTVTPRRLLICWTSLFSRAATHSNIKAWIMSPMVKIWASRLAMIWVEQIIWASTHPILQQMLLWQTTSWYSHKYLTIILCSCNNIRCRTSSHNIPRTPNRCISSHITSLQRSTWVELYLHRATKVKEWITKMLHHIHTWQHSN